MGKLNNLMGQRFGYLTVLARALPNTASNKARWRCLCDCGNITIAIGSSLISKHTISCGCYRGEVRSSHKMTLTKSYKRYISMKQRCYNPKDAAYPYYGGRGITLCDEWQTFEGYWKWAREHEYKESLTIERIDVNGNYGPTNCKFIPKQEQPLNTTYNVYITYKGETKIEKEWLRQWSKETGLKMDTIKYRIRKAGWTIEEALATPIWEKRNSTPKANND